MDQEPLNGSREDVLASAAVVNGGASSKSTMTDTDLLKEQSPLAKYLPKPPKVTKTINKNVLLNFA